MAAIYTTLAIPVKIEELKAGLRAHINSQSAYLLPLPPELQRMIEAHLFAALRSEYLALFTELYSYISRPSYSIPFYWLASMQHPPVSHAARLSLQRFRERCSYCKALGAECQHCKASSQESITECLYLDGVHWTLRKRQNAYTPLNHPEAAKILGSRPLATVLRNVGMKLRSSWQDGVRRNTMVSDEEREVLAHYGLHCWIGDSYSQHTSAWLTLSELKTPPEDTFRIARTIDVTVSPQQRLATVRALRDLDLTPYNWLDRHMNDSVTGPISDWPKQATLSTSRLDWGERA